MTEPTLYHYTCDDGRRGIGDEGLLRPHSHNVVWLTDLDAPIREALGLTSYHLKCDRTKHRYRATDTSTCVRWVDYEHRSRSIEIEGTRPMHWWVSPEPVPVVYDPHPLAINSLDDLLTPAERLRMRTQLGEMTKQRRRAEAEAANWWMP
jgi:hypothetical protein